MLNYFALIHKYYTPEKRSYKIFVVHAVLVTAKALAIGRKLGFTPKELEFLQEASMLHDLGVCAVNAPKIGCHGDLPYIAHGVAGAKLLRKHGLEAHARVAERHVGVGLTKVEIEARGLPLPHQDFIPVTQAEKVITYADSFFSKSNEALIWYEETSAQIKKELATFGPEQVKVFAAWEKEFAV
jgi:uncharacterized protein